ncbi:putative tetratricopeptide-like helical domain superfamily [Helianthus annuus]|uniref:Tetratricopeptide-like helical domain superfamily n=1 Tax=Helianthus annuus TaxID=4232 RepID=A0A9K3E7X8_HELAN|nr:putative tetratricopeptide-like helical domain superfamily [Helianthus annuus]KAJ0484976.1 putative tetratricopeptide-like helical domain superfamily [Helianthus annuus]KAJ0852840.1 putative tetratricopeptide-like helical domain superfamily [Helianthus annuus]
MMRVSVTKNRLLPLMTPLFGPWKEPFRHQTWGLRLITESYSQAFETTQLHSPITSFAAPQGVVGAMNKENIISYLKMCSNSTQLECIYACIVKNSYNQDCFMINQFVSACSIFNKMDYGIRAFTQMDHPNVFVYNAVIRACVCCSSPVLALRFYSKMLSAQVLPTSYTFSSVIKGCALVAHSRIGEAVNGHIWKFGFKSHVFVQTALIDFYSSVGRIFDARQVFDEMTERDVFAWTSMVSVHARAGDLVSAKKLFDEMPERNFASWNSLIDGYARIKDVESAEVLFSKMPQKDLISWTTMINCYSQNKLYQHALATFNDMTAHGIIPDEVTMATAISACAHLGALDIGKKIHRYIQNNSLKLDVYIGSSLIDMYAKCGSLDQSLAVFYKLPEKNLFCWNSVIEGLAVHGYANEALKMFNHMVKDGIKPNGVSFISVLSACTHAGLVKEGQRCFLSMIHDFHILPEIEHYGCMVDLLCKAGLLEDALQVIEEMRMEPNAVIWGAILGGCKLQKNLEIAKIAVDKLMILEPDNSGYYTLLVNMFAEANRWSEVARIRSTMKDLCVEKKSPGSSWIEINGKIHRFSASDKYHESCEEIYFLLNRLYGKPVLYLSVPELIFCF